MPYGDRTGPVGAGSITGRGAGFCAGNSMPGYINFSQRRGHRYCYYLTGVPGWTRAGYYQPALSEEAELNILKQEAKFMEERLNVLYERIKNSEKKEENKNE